MQWQEAYPNAVLYACPGLQSKKPEVRFDHELSPSEKAPPAWKGEVECACLSYERNPFTGKPFFNEVHSPRILRAKPTTCKARVLLWQISHAS